MAKTLGVVKVLLNQVSYRTKPGATVKLGGVTKTHHYGDGEIAGQSEEPTACEVHCTFVLMSDTDTEAIRNFSGQLDFVTDVGITYSSTNATIMEPPDISSPDGIACVLSGTAAVKS